MKLINYIFYSLVICIISTTVFGCRKQHVVKKAENPSVRQEPHGDVLPELTDEVVRSMLQKHLEIIGGETRIGTKWANAYDIANARIEPIGDRYRIISASPRVQSSPARVSSWIVSSSGVNDIEPDILTQAFSWLPAAITEQEKDELIKRYLSLLYTGGPFSSPGKIIKSLDDIEGYKNNPLDTDLESSICAPYIMNSNTRIFYTYQIFGGIVRRHRFQFNDKGQLNSVVVIVLGNRIGDYRSLQ